MYLKFPPHPASRDLTGLDVDVDVNVNVDVDVGAAADTSLTVGSTVESLRARRGAAAIYTMPLSCGKLVRPGKNSTAETDESATEQPAKQTTGPEDPKNLRRVR